MRKFLSDILVKASLGVEQNAYVLGTVGIGTTSPSEKLEVVGIISSARTTYGPPSDAGGFRLKVQDYGGIHNDAGIGIASSSGLMWFNNVAGGGFYWNDGTNGERMRLTAAGNLGIGTSSPGAKLEVYGGNLSLKLPTYAGSARYGFGNPARIDDAAYIEYNGAGDFTGSLIFATNGSTSNVAATEKMRITSAGNLGIGTTSPTARQSVLAAAARPFDWGNTVARGALTFSGINALVTALTGDLQLFTDNGATTGITVKATSGNVGIGTTSPGYKLEVNGGSVGNNIARFTTGGAGGGTRGLTVYSDNSQVKLQVTDNAGSQGTWAFLNLNPDGGNVGIGTTSPSQKLHVVGGALRVDNIGTQLALGTNGVAGAYEITTLTSNDLSIALSGVGERMRISSSGNVGIGTTSPGALLDVNGSLNSGKSIIRVTNSDTANYITVGAGIPGISNAGMNLTLDGTSRMVISAAGNVGIGVTSPGVRLDVSGDIRASNVLYGSSAFVNLIRMNGGTELQFRNSTNVEVMRITGGGEVLIGGSSILANGKLQVTGGIGLSGNTQIRQATNGDGNTLQIFATQFVGGNLNSFSYGYSGGGIIASVSAGDSALLFDAGRTTSTEGRFKIANTTSGNTSLSLEKNGVVTLFASTTGNVGIGTSSPSTKLQVSGASRVLNVVSSNDQVPASFGSSGFAVSTIGFYGVGSANDYNVRVGASVDAFVAYTNDTERMRILSGGNVGIGTSSPAQPLHVYTAGAVPILLERSTANANVSAQFKDATSSWYIGKASNGYFGIGGAADLGNATVFNITNGGNVGIGTNSPSYKLHVEGNVSGISIYASHDIAAFSDITVKKEVKKIENAIEKVKELNGYTYVRTDDETGTRRAGVIAQEVQKVLPEVVSANPDGTLNVAYSNMIALLIEGMKEQQATIERMQQEINELKK